MAGKAGADAGAAEEGEGNAAAWQQTIDGIIRKFTIEMLIRPPDLKREGFLYSITIRIATGCN